MLIDMPIDELRNYRGISPRPEDFDSYWTEALEELAAVDPRLELRKAEFQAPGVECFELFFTGVGNARIHAKLLRPAGGGPPHPACVQFHGYTGNSGDWVDKLAYAYAGFTYAALDSRGQAGLSEDTTPVRGTTLRGHIVRGADDPDPHKLLFRSNYLDCVQLVRIVMGMPEVDPERVGIWGVSQGGGLTAACAALCPEVNRAVSFYPFLSDFLRVWRMDLARDAYSELKDYFRWFDPTHAREEEFFLRLGYIDIHNLAPRTKCNYLMFTGLMDTVCPPSTQFAYFNNISSQEKEVVFYPDFAHEGLPGSLDRVFQFMKEML